METRHDGPCKREECRIDHQDKDAHGHAGKRDGEEYEYRADKGVEDSEHRREYRQRDPIIILDQWLRRQPNPWQTPRDEENSDYYDGPAQDQSSQAPLQFGSYMLPTMLALVYQQPCASPMQPPEQGVTGVTKNKEVGHYGSEGALR